jgi:flavin-dependent dehydrogenase
MQRQRDAVAVLVVGGGPVGLFAATAAARAGMEVTLIEARTGDGDKACGEGLMPTAVRALAELDVVPSGIPFRGIRYLSASGCHQVRADLRDGPGLGVRRTELVRVLRAAADGAGVKTSASRVTDVDTDRSGVTVRCSDGTSLHADVLLGCDGLSSTVRDAVGLERPSRGPRRYGLVGHFAVRPWSDDVEVHWAEHDEAYVTPVAPDLVGVALLGGAGGPYAERLRAFPTLASRLDDAEPVGRVLGAGPLRRTASGRREGNVLLVGDAAGYVDALTGEGLAIGFLSAQAAVASVLAGRLDRYEGQWARITRRFRWSTDLLVSATQQDAVRRRLVPAAASAPGLYRSALRLVT